MKTARNILLILISIFLISCASMDYVYKYRPNPVHEKQLSLPVYIDVRIADYKFFKQSLYPNLREDIRNALIGELGLVFNNIVENENDWYDIKATVEVKNFLYKNQSWPTIFPSLFVLSYIGSPIYRARAIVNYEVRILNKNDKLIKKYTSKKKLTKWVGLYYNRPSISPVSNNFVSYVVSKRAMDEIKNNIIKDRSEIEKYMTYRDRIIRDTVVVKEIVYVGKEKDNYVYKKLSDVDKDIPKNPEIHPMRFALIIGNEDYASNQVDLNIEANVDYARNDASAFKDYALNILGIPEQNIVFVLDGTTGKMKQAITKMNLIIKNTKGQADVFVYYAGHGLPEEFSKEPYLIPVDVSSKNVKDGIRLQDLYSELTEYPSKRITVFIDACFSGGARNQGLVTARGVKVKAKENTLSGNLVVFTSSSGSQSSLPLKDQEHGLYTYYLLKKLKETGGNINYKELSDYLMDNISLQSVLVNDREQTPQTNISNSVLDEWINWEIK